MGEAALERPHAAGWPMTRRLHLHIGPRKSGTTTVQSAMVHGQAQLRAAGLTYPLRGVTGSLGLNHEAVLIAASTPTPGPHAAALRVALRRTKTDVVLSGEAVATLTPSAAARLVAYLNVDSIHVIITARTISRVLPSTWQQGVRNGRLATYTAFLDAAVRLDEERTAHPDTWQEHPTQEFWRSQAIAGLAERWRRICDDVTVVTVPLDDGSPATLWQRFLAALGIDPGTHPDLQRLAPPQRHESISESQALLLREIMVQLDQCGMAIDERGWWARRLVREVFQRHPSRGPRLSLPPEYWANAAHWSARDIDDLQTLVNDDRIRLIGDVSDLHVGPIPPTSTPDGLLVRDIADLGGRCLAYLQGAR